MYEILVNMMLRFQIVAFWECTPFITWRK